MRKEDLDLVKEQLGEKFNITGLTEYEFAPCDSYTELELTGYFWAEQHINALVVEYPSDWWDAFKARWLSKWLPVNYSRANIIIRTVFKNFKRESKDKTYSITRSVLPTDRFYDGYKSLTKPLQKQKFGRRLILPNSISTAEVLVHEFGRDLTILTEAKKHKLKIPADWQQAFKERWFPEWLTDRYPVEFMTINPNDMGIEYDNPLHNEDFVHIVWSVTYE